jgi:hypothetical protein
MMNDEFYVGYVPRAPKRLAGWLRTAVTVIVAGGAFVALTLTFAQHPFPAATFEYGETHTFSGVIRNFPSPSLETEDRRIVLLVAPGKRGAQELARAYDGKSVDLMGTRIQRDGDRMIEVVPGSIRVMNARVPAAPDWLRVGEFELQGEIVDSKCYLGVMNPGEGKVHRDCAARCISGGIPPALIARDQAGRRKLVLLTGAQGRAIHREVLSYVGEPVSVRGIVFRSGDRLRIEAEPEQIRRVE